MLNILISRQRESVNIVSPVKQVSGLGHVDNPILYFVNSNALGLVHIKKIKHLSGEIQYVQKIIKLHSILGSLLVVVGADGGEELEDGLPVDVGGLHYVTKIIFYLNTIRDSSNLIYYFSFFIP